MLATPTGFNTVDGNLYDWNSLKDDAYRWNGIFIGNGASISVWDNFNYPSIFNRATLPDAQQYLTASDKTLFLTLGTQNFEQVLSSLKTASIISQALGLDDTVIIQRYNSIKQALINAISDVHIPWNKVPAEVLATIRSALLDYKYIYTTNYDLLIYWSVMYQDPAPFTDYFYTEDFDTSNTKIFFETTKRVLYLHGALHLYKHPSGTTLKRRTENGRNLLELFGQPYTGYPDVIPLIVSEGTSDDKLSSIKQSDYLTFAFNKFSEHPGPLVVFGQSLSTSDMHIVNAMKKWRDRRIAIALLPDTQTNIRQKQASLIAQLPEALLYFFDATTHPLGSPGQKVTP